MPKCFRKIEYCKLILLLIVSVTNLYLNVIFHILASNLNVVFRRLINYKN